MDDLSRTFVLSRTGNYMTVAGLVMLIYDYFLTFGNEVELVWSSKWNMMKVLYFLSRFSAFIDLPIVVSRNVAPGLYEHPRVCYVLFCTTCGAALLNFGSAELILIWRTYALWGNSQRILVFLLTVLSVVYCGLIVCVGIYLHSMQFGKPPVKFIQCWVTKSNNIIFVGYALVMLAETVIMATTIWIGFRRHRHSQNELVRTLYRDGIYYYIYIFFISVANIIISITGPQELVDAINGYQSALHSILATRIILNVRRAAQAEGTLTLNTKISEIGFRRRDTYIDTGTQWHTSSDIAVWSSEL